MWLVATILESEGRMYISVTIYSKIFSFPSIELQQSDYKPKKARYWLVWQLQFCFNLQR